MAPKPLRRSNLKPRQPQDLPDAFWISISLTCWSTSNGIFKKSSSSLSSLCFLFVVRFAFLVLVKCFFALSCCLFFFQLCSAILCFGCFGLCCRSALLSFASLCFAPIPSPRVRHGGDSMRSAWMLHYIFYYIMSLKYRNNFTLLSLLFCQFYIFFFPLFLLPYHLILLNRII